MKDTSHDECAALRAEIACLRQQIADLQQTGPHTSSTTTTSYNILQAILNHSSTGILIKNYDGMIIHASRSHASLFGTTPEDIVGKTTKELFADPIFNERRRSELQIMNTGEAQTLEEPVPLDDGMHTFQVDKFPIYDEHQTCIGIGIVAADITEWKRMSEQLRQAHDELEQRVAERTKQLFTVIEDLHCEMGERLHVESALRRSEERYREITELISDSVYSVHFNHDGTLELEWGFNGLEPITGYTQDEMPANDWLRIVHPDDLPRIEARMQHVFDGQPVETDYRVVAKDGTIHWLRDHGRPIWDEQENRVVRLYGAIKDITVYRQASEALAQSEERLRTLVSALPDMVFRIDQNGIFVDFKKPHNEQVLMAPDIFLGTSYQDVLPPLLSESLTRAIHQARQSGEVERFEYWLPSQNDTRYYYEARIIVGSDNHTFCIVRNISDYKQAEADIRQLANRAETLSRIAARLNMQLDLPTIFQAVAAETRQAITTDSIVIYLINQQQQILDMVYYEGLPPDYVANLEKVPCSIMTHVPIIVHHDIRQETWLPNNHLTVALDMRTMVRTLVARGDEMIGVILGFTIGKERTYTDNEISLMLGIANQAAQAIANARLFEEVQRERAMLSQRVAERTADLSRSNAELARALRIKDEFLANMSHELRTPLNVILGMSESLQEEIYGPVNPRQKRSLETIANAGHHLLSLINDILDLSKIEAGKVEIMIEPVSIEGVCHASLHFIKQQASAKHISVSLSIDTNLIALQPHAQHMFANSDFPEVVIHADQRRLKQILINLLTNAIKFTPEGGQVGLEVKIEEHNQVVHFTVWDTGIGISPDDQKWLFQPFIQLDSRLARQYEGTGLGLALVMRLTELHRGSVSLESEVGKGSRFCVSLPQYCTLDQTYYAHKSELDNSGFDQPVDVTEIGVSSMRHTALIKQRILLAEDNEANIIALSEYLETKGYHIVVARNGQEAVERVLEEPPDIILMDIQMPKMDGLEAIRQIRSQTQFAQVPIIALTALAMKGDRERCIEAGANEYVSKPVRMRELAKMIAGMVGNSCERTQLC